MFLHSWEQYNTVKPIKGESGTVYQIIIWHCLTNNYESNRLKNFASGNLFFNAMAWKDKCAKFCFMTILQVTSREEVLTINEKEFITHLSRNWVYSLYNDLKIPKYANFEIKQDVWVNWKVCLEHLFVPKC